MDSVRQAWVLMQPTNGPYQWLWLDPRADQVCGLAEGNHIATMTCSNLSNAAGTAAAPTTEPQAIPPPTPTGQADAPPDAAQGSEGEPQYRTANGLQTVYSMTQQLQAAGYDGPTDPSVIAAYAQITGGPVMPNDTTSRSP
jgi:hypothetical protein